MKTGRVSIVRGHSRQMKQHTKAWVKSESSTFKKARMIGEQTGKRGKNRLQRLGPLAMIKILLFILTVRNHQKLLNHDETKFMLWNDHSSHV